MYPITDSHVHLVCSQNKHLWHWTPPHPLAKNLRLDEYLQDESDIKNSAFEIEGLVWIEADSVYVLDNGIEGVRAPIDECAYVSRYNSETKDGEGESKPGFVKAYIPWAPIPWGNGLEQYVDEMKKQVADFQLVKGFRFLLQDKPKETMLDPKFIEGLRWLEAHNYVFDWGIDLRCGGMWQFEETLSVFRQVPNVKYIINHLTKPNLRAVHPEETEEFRLWADYMAQFYALTPNSYMKLSGGFSELPEELYNDTQAAADRIFPWFKVAFDLWGSERTIWASNWPVCAMFAGEGLNTKWFNITEALFDRISLPEAERLKVYSTNYLEAYNIDLV